jgi:2-polyprenyl-6-methoxyphenol hydroxylase-like FAD-dependent oxidoreductase
MKQGDDSLKQFIAEHLQGACLETNEIIKGMIEARDFYANEIVQVKPPTLYKGRFVLVGDAACALGFTSACTTLTLAEAYVLAGEVGRHKGNPAAGLRSYED